MKFPRGLLVVVLTAACVAICASRSVSAGGDEWRAIDPAELSSKTPIVDKDADAEAIFWEVRIDDSQNEEIAFKNYIRIKVFTERGKESQSKVDLPYFGNSSIKDVAGRVIKPDGTVIELKKEDVFDRTIVKTSGLKVKAKSFALAGVEPGGMIEYRWREVYPGASAQHLKLYFQREIPVRNVTYYFRPFSGMQAMPFRLGDSKFVKDKDGFFKMAMSNMPAVHEEAQMPPDKEVRAWLFLYFSEETKVDRDKYWMNYGRHAFEVNKDGMKVSDEVKSALPGIIGDAATPEEKLQRIYDFCRTKIKNVTHAPGMTEDEKKKFKENKSAGETLKRGIGNSANIDLLFAALAKAAGFDVHLALSGNRDDLFFDKGLVNSYFLGSSFIAVHVGDRWEYFSPAELYTPFGMLSWTEEGQDVLVTDTKEPVWARTPISPPDKSQELRSAKLRLLEDGTLEGDVRIEYTGHLAFDKKSQNADDSSVQREQTLKDSLKQRMGGVEVSDVKVENADDPVKPFVYSYHVRAPGYAQRTGKRLFLQPAFFEHGVGALFAPSQRSNAIYFHYPWAEHDHVTVELPAGFVLDNAESPEGIAAAMTKNICELQVKIAASNDGHFLVYDRAFFFGGGGSIQYGANNYPALKQLFDRIHLIDEHTIALKQSATPN
jgi:hypothetical protein